MESKSSSKRLLFDRRYGWVIDEWKDPSEEALAGGRGMFCIVPLTKAVFSLVSRTINSATESAIKALETPDMLSPQSLQANIRESFDNLMGLMHNPNACRERRVEIKVLLFARARDVAGMGEIRLEVTFGTTTLDCVNKIFTTFPGPEEIRECMVLALNEEYTSFSTIVQNRDELAIIPPISGG